MRVDNIITIAIVAVAAGFILMRVIKHVRSKTPSCSCCDGGKSCSCRKYPRTADQTDG